MQKAGLYDGKDFSVHVAPLQVCSVANLKECRRAISTACSGEDEKRRTDPAP